MHLNNVKKIREELLLNKVELARKAGVSPLIELRTGINVGWKPKGR